MAQTCKKRCQTEIELWGFPGYSKSRRFLFCLSGHIHWPSVCPHKPNNQNLHRFKGPGIPKVQSTKLVHSVNNPKMDHFWTAPTQAAIIFLSFLGAYILSIVSSKAQIRTVWPRSGQKVTECRHEHYKSKTMPNYTKLGWNLFLKTINTSKG